MYFIDRWTALPHLQLLLVDGLSAMASALELGVILLLVFCKDNFAWNGSRLRLLALRHHGGHCGRFTFFHGTPSKLKVSDPENIPFEIPPNSQGITEELSSVSVRDDFVRTGAWVAAAVGFALSIAHFQGSEKAIEFASGYVLEESLSVDNLFVFLLLFKYFKVSKQDEMKILEYGILGAVLLRGLFIFLGAVALEQFHQIVILFSVVLFAASYNILFKREDSEEEDLEGNSVVRFSKHFLKSTDQFDGSKFFTKISGQKVATPLLLCLVCVELSDILFAFDSVPAVFGVTDDPFIVYTSNVFAICSLRSLYGVLSSAVSQLQYLEKAVGVILAVIGAKLAAGAFDIELFSPLQSLVVVVALLSGGIGLSLWDKPR